MVVVGNKSDLPERGVTLEEGEEFAAVRLVVPLRDAQLFFLVGVCRLLCGPLPWSCLDWRIPRCI